MTFSFFSPPLDNASIARRCARSPELDPVQYAENIAFLRKNLSTSSNGPIVYHFIRLAGFQELGGNLVLLSMLALFPHTAITYAVFPNARSATIATLQSRQMGLDGLICCLSHNEAYEIFEKLPGPSLICFSDASESEVADLATPSKGNDYSWPYRLAIREEISNNIEIDAEALHQNAFSHLRNSPPQELMDKSGTAKIDLNWFRSTVSFTLISHGLYSGILEIVEDRSVLLRRSSKDAPIIFRSPRDKTAKSPIIGEAFLRAENTILARASIRLRSRPEDADPDLITCFQNRGGSGNAIVRAMANAIGAELRFAEDPPHGPEGTVIVWGVLRGSQEVINRALTDQRTFYYIDHAYFDRGHGRNYRITRDRYDAGEVRLCPTDRLDRLNIKVKDWGTQGDVIVVCPPTDYFMAAHGCASWLDDTIAALKTVTDRQIIIRTKPAPGEVAEPLDSLFARSWALVTHSSNIAIEAAVAGVPVFVAPSSAARAVGLTDLACIERPARPDRTAWLANLAYSQFTHDEVADGTAWQLLREFESFPLAKMRTNA